MRKTFITIYLLILILILTSGCQTTEIRNEVSFSIEPSETEIVEISPSEGTVEPSETEIVEISSSEETVGPSETEVIEISPYEETVYNNGGSVIQYGDYVYYCAITDNKYMLLSMHTDSLEKLELFEASFNSYYYDRNIYAVDGYIFSSGFNDVGEQSIIRVTTSTGSVEYLEAGVIEYVDTESKEIFYRLSAYNLPEEEQGIYKIDLDGGNKTKLCPYGYSFLAISDGIIYLEAPHDENSNDAVLASMNTDGSGLKTIATIPADEIEVNITEYEHIVDFGLCDGWIILSVGSYQGSGNFYYGGLIRLRYDGSEMERFYDSDIDYFEIIDDWIYFNDWNANLNPNDEGGCYRMHPDLSEKEYLGDEIQYMNAYSKDGYLYYWYNSSAGTPAYNIINDLRQCTPDSQNVITLFYGNDAPQFEDSDYISYANIVKVGEYIYFGVVVHGYTGNDNWRGHTCYYGYYRVRSDGSNLELLYQDETLHCPSITND